MLRFLRRNLTESGVGNSNSHSSVASSSGEGLTAISTSQTDRDEANVKASTAFDLSTSPRKFRNKKSSNRIPSSPISATSEREFHAIRLKQVFSTTMIDGMEGLKAFDSCIETSDALLSTSTSSGRGIDHSTGLIDCSVLVSADGDLLIIPQQQNGTEKQESRQDRLRSGSENIHGEGDENEILSSAVFLGNDLPGQGDKVMNGFSTKGWSMAAASLALKQSTDSMDNLVKFLDEYIRVKKSSIARKNQTIDKLRTMVGVERSELKASKVIEYQKYVENLNQTQKNFLMTKLMNQKQQQENNTDVQVSPDRVGPLNYSGGTISATLKALEEYYSSVTDLQFKQLVSMSHPSGALTKLRNATIKCEDRVRCRQVALRDATRKIKTMENYLRECKEDAKIKWEKVHQTELLVTQLVEEKMMMKNKIREEERRKQMEDDEVRRERDEKGKSTASTSDILDIVSAATASMEEGSFEAMVDLSSVTSSILTENESSMPESTNFAGPEGLEMEMDSRYEFEMEYRLPELRVVALAADRAVEDAATSLLSILSNSDTTSRSAQLAAETCLVSSGNAQASCLRSIIASERELIEERMKLLNALEDIANEIDVRGDVNRYITIDKKKQGGRSYRGEDDDGGVASALNHLHSDPASESEKEIDKNFCEDDGKAKVQPDDLLSISPECIEESLNCFFQNDPLLRNDIPRNERTEKSVEEFESSVINLCTIGEGKSSKYVTRRSTICYAMNAKRSTNFAQIPSLRQFNGLCRVFAAVLTGCNSNDDKGVSSAVLLMGLSQHFHIQDGEKKIYVKSRLIGHSIWDNQDFWDRALKQTIKETLNYSSVLSTFERESQQAMTTEKKKRSEWMETHKTRWHDLTEAERYQAASQVNAVIYSQVSSMADSMLELCGDREKTSAFVRRVCVKNKLPMSQRTALLRHLTGGLGNEIKDL